MGLPAIRRLRRHPTLYWLVAAAAALVAVSTVWRLSASADAAARRWGDLVEVPVAARDIPAGSVLGPGDLSFERWPAALAVGAAEQPVGRRLVHPLVTGELVTVHRLAPEGLGPVASLVPDGHVAVGLPDTGTGLRLHVGDRVDLIATFDPDLTGGEPSFVVAAAALVVDVGEHGVAVAVPRRDGPRVAYALSTAVVVPALSAE